MKATVFSTVLHVVLLTSYNVRAFVTNLGPTDKLRVRNAASILQGAGRGSGHQQLRHTPFIVSAVGGSYAADAGNEDEKKGEDNMISL